MKKKNVFVVTLWIAVAAIWSLVSYGAPDQIEPAKVTNKIPGMKTGMYRPQLSLQDVKDVILGAFKNSIYGTCGYYKVKTKSGESVRVKAKKQEAKPGGVETYTVESPGYYAIEKEIVQTDLVQWVGENIVDPKTKKGAVIQWCQPNFQNTEWHIDVVLDKGTSINFYYILRLKDKCGTDIIVDIPRLKKQP